MGNIAYLITVASIVGTLANSFGRRWCFYVWLCTNAFWVVFNITTQSYAQALLYLFNFATCIIGLIKWKGRKNQ